jgi:hypothetical protein
VAGQLPKGFILPPSDAHLGVSAVAFEDLDDDGDIDIVATEPDGSTGPVDLVVWVNDGSGRLARKTSTPSNTLGREPALPSLEQHDGAVVVSVHPDAPATETLSANGWLTLPWQPYRLALVAVPPSGTPATLRSRSPPVIS